MAIDPYALLRALLRAEAARNAKAQVPQVKAPEPEQLPKEKGR